MSLIQAVVSRDGRVPTQHPLGEALTIYAKRLGLLLAVALANLLLLFLALVAVRSSLLPAAVSLIIALLAVQVLRGRSTRRITEQSLSMWMQISDKTDQALANFNRQIELGLLAAVEQTARPTQRLLEEIERRGRDLHELTLDQRRTNRSLLESNENLAQSLNSVVLELGKPDQETIELNARLIHILSEIGRRQAQSNQLLMELNEKIELIPASMIEYQRKSNQLASEASRKGFFSTVAGLTRAVVEGFRAGSEVRRVQKETTKSDRGSVSAAYGVARERVVASEVVASEVAARQKEQIAAAIEAGKQAYREEKKYKTGAVGEGDDY